MFPIPIQLCYWTDANTNDGIQKRLERRSQKSRGERKSNVMKNAEREIKMGKMIRRNNNSKSEVSDSTQEKREMSCSIMGRKCKILS